MLAGLIVGSMFVAKLTLGYFTARQPAQRRFRPFCKTARRPRRWVRGSRSTRQDLARMRTAEDARLDSYGRDPLSGLIHIPIGQAMKLEWERGLPVRTGEVRSEKVRM